MPTLDPTVGGPTANTYADATFAADYFDARLNSAAFTSASVESQARALITATRWLDTLAFVGEPATDTQALQWPRREVEGVADDVIPVPVAYATCEVALALLAAGSSDLLAVDATAGVKRKKVDVLETEYFGPMDRPEGLEKVPQALRLLAPYLAASGGLAVVRV